MPVKNAVGRTDTIMNASTYFENLRNEGERRDWLRQELAATQGIGVQRLSTNRLESVKTRVSDATADDFESVIRYLLR